MSRRMSRLYLLIEDFSPTNCWRQGHAWLPCLMRDIREVLRR